MVFTAVLSCLGLVGLALLKSLLLGIHAVSSLALGAALGAYHTGVYMLLADRCDRTQSSFRGCDSCACAAANTCTRTALGDPACAACRAWPTDVCSKANGFFPYMGLSVLLLMCLPAVFSLLVLMRLEKAHSDLASRVLYARTLVLRELERLRDGFGLSVEVGVLTHMMATLMRHGSPRDRGPVGSCCELLQLEPGSLEVEWQDVEAQGGRSKWQSTIAAFTANGLPLGSGSTKYPASAAMFAAAGGRPQPDPLMDATLPASAGAIPPGPISVSVSPLGESSLIKSGGTRQGTLGVVPAAPPPPSATTSLPTPGSGPGSTAAAGATVSPPQAQPPSSDPSCGIKWTFLARIWDRTQARKGGHRREMQQCPVRTRSAMRAVAVVRDRLSESVASRQRASQDRLPVKGARWPVAHGRRTAAPLRMASSTRRRRGARWRGEGKQGRWQLWI
ncbi:hypothetical protein Vretimale_7799 [Volvox reticuliferus]|uniref:Uncharacterized protein n=1 Tax=Volvox reticuliferus TaxID=1737510 RepID=A0A8J4GA99_9CHLO|nr:hypothetical protein Vretimale_7799 [Volvox reticuliferus]